MEKQMPADKQTLIGMLLDKYDLIAYMAIAMWASVASYVHAVVKDGKRHSWLALVGEMMASGLSGMMMYFIGVAFNLDGHIVAMLCGISGWAGARMMDFLEALLKRWATAYAIGRKQMDKNTGDCE